MLAIRLRRTGSKKRPFFRVVVTDSRTARDSSFVEVLGHYNPRTKPETLDIKRERLEHWLKLGASPSDTVRTLVARMPPARKSWRRRNSPRREPFARRRRSRRPDACRPAPGGSGVGARAQRADADRAVHGARGPGAGHRTPGSHRRCAANAGRDCCGPRGCEGHAGVQGRTGTIARLVVARRTFDLGRACGVAVDDHELGGSGSRRPGGASARDPRTGGGEPGDGLSRGAVQVRAGAAGRPRGAAG